VLIASPVLLGRPANHDGRRFHNSRKGSGNQEPLIERSLRFLRLSQQTARMFKSAFIHAERPLPSYVVPESQSGSAARVRHSNRALAWLPASPTDRTHQHQRHRERVGPFAVASRTSSSRPQSAHNRSPPPNALRQRMTARQLQPQSYPTQITSSRNPSKSRLAPYHACPVYHEVQLSTI